MEDNVKERLLDAVLDEEIEEWEGGEGGEYEQQQVSMAMYRFRIYTSIKCNKLDVTDANTKRNVESKWGGKKAPLV